MLTPPPTPATPLTPPEPPATVARADVIDLELRVRELEVQKRALEIEQRELEVAKRELELELKKNRELKAEKRALELELKNRDLERENRVLVLQVKDLRQQLWGKKSERYVGDAGAAPVDLFAELGATLDTAAAEATAEAASDTTLLAPLSAFTPQLTDAAAASAASVPTSLARAQRRRRPGRRPLDPALPRELYRVPDPLLQQRICPETGRPLIPGFTEVIEVLARRPATYYVKRFERTLWVCDPQSPVRSAPLATPWPTGVWPRARIDVSVVAHLAAAHYAEHQPFYRLEQQLDRAGVRLPRSTQVSLMDQLAAAVAPLGDLLRDEILKSGYLHLDATPIQVCDPARPGATREATLWAYRAGGSGLAPADPGPVWYDYRPTKAMAGPQEVLTAAKFRGLLQTDGAGGFDKLANLLAAQRAAEDATGPPAVTHIGCLAHARRRHFKAVKLGDRGAAWYLERINRLYRIDRRMAEALAGSRRGRVLTPAEREAWRDRVRQRFSVPLFDRLLARAALEAPTVPPKSLLGEALQYLLAQQGPLRRCVTTPGVRLDNNSVENKMRPPRLGERNWLFVGHPAAGPRLAALYTVVENARQEGLDVEAYLLDVLTRLPETPQWELPLLLPRAWRQARDVGVLRPSASRPA